MFVHVHTRDDHSSHANDNPHHLVHRPLVMIHWGMYVSALSMLFLAFSTSLCACVMFVIMLSEGESLWSPHLHDYTTSMAVEGCEGTYMALSLAPLILAKLPVWFMSGKLLQRYLPEHLGEGKDCHSKTMWQIIALSMIISSVLITLLWGYISGGGAPSKWWAFKQPIR